MINIPICQDIPMIKPIELTLQVMKSVDEARSLLSECQGRLRTIQDQLDPASPEYILFGKMFNSAGSMYVDLKKFEKSAREAYSRH